MSSKSREWNSETYRRVSKPQFEWGKKVLARVKLRGNETIADAGCGTGRLTAELLRILPEGRVVAIDLSRNMISTAREQLAPEFGNRIQFVVADLQRLPFQSVFDGIFSTAAFHWVPDHDILFRSLWQSLKPGGWLVAQCGGGPNLARLHARVAVLSATPPFDKFVGNYRDSWVFSDSETAAERLRTAGFTQIETSTEPAPTRFPDAPSYSEFVANVILHRRLERIPDPDLRERFLGELSKQAAAEDPPFELDYWRLNLSAQRPS
jgi:trans-aconitate 2-methyltransferase